MTLAAAAQMRQEGLRAVHHAPKINVHQPVEIINRDMLSQRPKRHASIVHDQVASAMLLQHLLSPSKHLLALGDIDPRAADLDGAALQQSDGLRQAVCVHITQRQMAAACGQG